MMKKKAYIGRYIMTTHEIKILQKQLLSNGCTLNELKCNNEIGRYLKTQLEYLSNQKSKFEPEDSVPFFYVRKKRGTD